MAHERSITVKVDGKWVNIPSVFQGKVITEHRAVQLFKQGKLPKLGGKSFSTLKEAVEAARKRSKSFRGH